MHLAADPPLVLFEGADNINFDILFNSICTLYQPVLTLTITAGASGDFFHADERTGTTGT
jgi:hypothetical protein